MEAQHIVKFKNVLLEKRSLLAERLEKIEVSKFRKEPLNADSSEQAQEVVNHEVVDALDDLEGAELSRIDHALERIKNGSFGNCLNCGEEISLPRLEAIPFAQKCMNCANESQETLRKINNDFPSSFLDRTFGKREFRYNS